jgi:hypothetical protein
MQQMKVFNLLKIAEKEVENRMHISIRCTSAILLSAALQIK